MLGTKNPNDKQNKQFCNDRDLRRFHKQKFRNGKLNHHCEHVIRNGEPVTLSLEQREQFIQNICDIPDNPVHLGLFCGMVTYVCIAWLPSAFTFSIAFGLRQANERIASQFYIAGTALLLLVLAGFVGLCIFITRRNKKRANKFRTEVREKIRFGDYKSYAYQIEEIYRTESYDEDAYGGYIRYWYRVGDVIFELPNSAFAYNLGKNGEVLYKDPEILKSFEHNHPVGGYITGMLIHLDGQERFYGM